jgi:hypothetical protein
MNYRICRCCGERMPETGNALSRNPNICASCSSLADGIEDSAETEESHLGLSGERRAAIAAALDGAELPEQAAAGSGLAAASRQAPWGPASASALPLEKDLHNLKSGPIHFTAETTPLSQEPVRPEPLAIRKPASGARMSSSGPALRGQRLA